VAVRDNGIGLSFCKRVVEAHSGWVGVKSEEGAVATFWFELKGVPVALG
jgi:signal transduction histidine kinase